jgi:hypothetical protein
MHTTAVDQEVIMKFLGYKVEGFSIKGDSVRKMDLKAFLLLPFLKSYLKNVILYICHEAQSQERMGF